MKEAKEVFAERYRDLWKQREEELHNTRWYRWSRIRHLKKAINYYRTMTERFEK